MSCTTSQVNNITINQTQNNGGYGANSFTGDPNNPNDLSNLVGATSKPQTMEEYLRAKNNLEDQIDYNFIQRIIQELTQSCALPLPIPAASIPPLILQAAQWFWQNCDFCNEERYLLIKNQDFCRLCHNTIIKLPPQVLSVFGVYKVKPNYYYGEVGDFTLERMIVNNTILASGAGGIVSDTFGNGQGYNLTDMMGALYEIQTFKAMFDYPITFNYNEFSNDLVILGELGHSDLVLQTFIRCKIQDLYKNYYFFRFCVCLGLRSMATIMGAFEFRLPGGVTINYSTFRDQANDEMQRIEEWVAKQHSADYFFNSNTI